MESRYAVADLLAHPDRKHLELVDGRLIERGLGAWASAASVDFMCVIANFGRAERRGWLFAPTLAFRCFADPDRVRHASWSYVRRSRLHVPGREFFSTTVPDLVVEMTPPYLNPDEVPARIDDFLAAGTPLAWVSNYRKRTILVRRPGAPDSLLREQDMLSGEDILPGFSVKVADLFPPFLRGEG